MEVIRAIIGMLIGVMFLSVIFRIASPLIMFFLLLIVFSGIRSWLFRRTYTNSQQQSRTNSNQQRSSQQSSQRSSQRGYSDDIIDAEFTEEEVEQ